jgi:hypothetical protein
MNDDLAGPREGRDRRSPARAVLAGKSSHHRKSLAPVLMERFILFTQVGTWHGGCTARSAFLFWSWANPWVILASGVLAGRRLGRSSPVFYVAGVRTSRTERLTVFGHRPARTPGSATTAPLGSRSIQTPRLR